MAKLAAGTPPDRLGRALGLLGAMQAVGQTSAPLAGGLAAEVSWRWAFAAIAVVALLLAVCRLPPDGPHHHAGPARLRDAWRRSVLLPGLLALVGWACLSGLSFLVAFRLEDTFGLSSGLRGLVLTGYGLVGFLTARHVGGLSDRFGTRSAAVLGLAAGGVLVAAIGIFDSLPVVAAAWALGGVCGQLIIVAVNTTVLSAGERGRSGAISVVQALRFLGMAAAPAAFTAPYHADTALGFLLPATLLVLVVPLALTLRPGRR